MIRKRKVFFAWQMDKEKAWLESMASQGYVLKATKPFTYLFEEGTPEDLVYGFDFQIMSKSKEPEYLSLFEGWTHVGSYGGWYYFYKQKESPERDIIYSDNASKKAMFGRLIGFLAIVGFPIYYQMLFIFPNMDAADLSFPKFYFFFRVIMLIIMVLHMTAIIKLLGVMAKYNKQLHE